MQGEGLTTGDGVIPPEYETTRNSEKFEINAQVLPSGYRTTGPTIA